MTNAFQPIDKARYKAAFMLLAQQSRFTHWLTLNTHRDCSVATAARYLKRWRVEVLRHVHGYRFYNLPTDQVTLYLGCPELSPVGHPHFHLAVAVPALATPKFELAAPRRWKDILPSGTSHLVPIGSSPDDQRKVLAYASKLLNQHADLPFLHSQVDR
ncbi:MAG: hypothetical protein IV097_00480 [Burkholderiaceae bacterium]|nr:hypothetical protein [Burkholderiaceae bacterium]